MVDGDAVADSSDSTHEVVAVRHGETEWSKDGRHTGRTDLPLVESGRAAAEALRPRLARWDFALVLVSPMARARETCRLAGLGDEAVVDDDLREWDYGDYDGVTTAQVRERTGDPSWTVWSHPAMPKGETVEQVGARVDRVVTRAAAAGGPVALFGHGHSLRILMARWLGLDPIYGQQFALGTGTLNVLGHEHTYRVLRQLNA
jgi:broad specificity phosphatase PhoE